MTLVVEDLPQLFTAALSKMPICCDCGGYLDTITKASLPMVGQGDYDEDDLDAYWYLDNPDLIPEVAQKYGWPAGSTPKRWDEGPGKTKTKQAIGQAREGLSAFGTKIRDLDDWPSYMRDNNIPPNLWDAYATTMVGSLSESDKTGITTGTPTMGCRVGGKRCNKCYAKNTENAMPGYYKNAWNHLRQLGTNPTLHASALAYLLAKNPEYRGNMGGDYQNVSHMAHALSVAAASPNTHHWLHTKEVPDIVQYLSQFEKFSPEWHNAIPENVMMRFSQPYDHMGPWDVTQKDWVELLDPNDPTKGVHPRIQPAKTGSHEGKENVANCPTTLGIKDLEGEKIKTCEQANCRYCREGEGTVNFVPHHGGRHNVKMANKEGEQQRAYTPEEFTQVQAQGQQDYYDRMENTPTLDELINRSENTAFDVVWRDIRKKE